MTDFQPILRDANRRLSAELQRCGQSVWSADIGDRHLDVLDLVITGNEASPNKFELVLGSLAVLRDRVYAVDGRRVCWARTFIPAGIAKGTLIEEEDTGPGGVPARLADQGHALVTFVEDVEFVEREGVSDEERDKLRIGGDTGVARVVRQSADAAGRVVEVTDMRLVASAYRFRWGWTNP